MISRRLILALILGVLVSSFAQGYTFAQEKAFSLELGTGLYPVQTLLSGDLFSTREELAPKGQTVSLAFTPTITISGVWRVNPSSEYLLTGCLTWTIYNVFQYGAFGMDPNGNPRYDLYDEIPAGRMNSGFSPCITFRHRRIWNPERACAVYSGLGLGLAQYEGEAILLPELTFLGFKYSWSHFQIFLENTYGPFATALHGGIGWGRKP